MPLNVRSSVEDLLARAHERVTRELSQAERVKYLGEAMNPIDLESQPSPVEIITAWVE